MLLRRQTDLEQHRGERIINNFFGVKHWNLMHKSNHIHYNMLLHL